MLKLGIGLIAVILRTMWLLDILSDHAVQPTVGCLRRLSTPKVMADQATTSFSTPINDGWEKW
jgi:hypothetical protein